jgi:hypothetical protein
MAKTGFYATKTNRKLTPDSASLPNISQALDSVRAYQWEISFQLPSTGVEEAGGIEPHLTLAAKQVTAMGFTSEAIEVHRTNDKVFYPGKASPEEVTPYYGNGSRPLTIL